MATFQERYQAAMVLGGVGDSLGNKWRHCPNGIQIYDELLNLGGVDALDIKPPDWRISSCTRMHVFTARAFAKLDQMTSTRRLLEQIMFEYCTLRDMDSHDVFDDLFITACLLLRCSNYKKEKHYTVPFHADASGSPAAVRAMCIGLRYHNPDDFRFLLEVSIESGRITHHHPVGYLGAFTTALFTSYAIQGRPFQQWGHGLIHSLPEALEYIKLSDKQVPENTEVWNGFAEKWNHFLELREISFGTSGPVIPKHDDIANREEFYKSICLNRCPGSQGWDAPMIAYDAILCFDGSWKNLCMRSICHSGLSNVTGSIAACWYGAMYGFNGIQKRNFLKVESTYYLQALGHMIHAISSPHFSIHGQISNIGITRRSMEPHEDPFKDKRKDAQENNEDVDAKIPELQKGTNLKVINKRSEEGAFLADVKEIVLQTVAQVTHNKNDEVGIVVHTNNAALQTELPQTDAKNETLDTLVNDNKAVLQGEAPEMNVRNINGDANVNAMVPALQTKTKTKYANDTILDAVVVSKRKETEENMTYKDEDVEKHIDAKTDVFQTETKVIYSKREDVMALIGTKVTALQEETLNERAKRIANTIYSHIKIFCDKISYLPPMIKTIEILKVGSFSEGTKIIQPDEFDFIAVLEGNFELGSLKERNDVLQTSGEHLSLEQIFDNFTKNLYIVIVNKDNTTLMKNATLYNFIFSDQEHVPLPTVNGLNMTVKLLCARQPNIILEFRESNMVISVDLTPAIRTTNWRKTFQPDHVVHRQLRTSILEKDSLLLVNYKENLKLTMTEVEVEHVKQTLQKKHKRLYVYLKYFNGLYAKGNVFEMAGFSPFSSYMLKTVCIYHDELCDTKKNKNVSLECLYDIIAILEKSLNNGYLIPSENLKNTWVGYLPSLFDKNMNLYYEPGKPVDFLIEFRKLMVRDLQSIFVSGRKWADLNDFCSTVERHVYNSADVIGSKTWSYSKYLLPLNYAS